MTGGFSALEIAPWVVARSVDAVRAREWVGLLALMALGSSSLPVPSEVAPSTSGYLVHGDVMDPWRLLGGARGIHAGSYLDYYVGYAFGTEVLRKLPRVRATPPGGRRVGSAGTASPQ
ncbi:MAG: DedA family protein [Conexivisphaera sp.]